jgi:methionyl-tRNA formyltransferase
VPGPLCPSWEFALRILFAGTPDAAVPSLRAVLDSAHEVVAVLSRPDAPAGRGRKVTASPVSALARSSGLTVLTPDSVRAPEFPTELAALDIDAAAVVGYGKLLPQPVLDAPKHGGVNLHFSLLPAWRGAAPVQAAIRAGDELTGATTFRLEAGMDTGPVYGMVTEGVRPADTAGELLGRLAQSGARLLVATLDGIADGSLQPRSQPAEGVSLAPKITPESARIDWATPALAIDRHIRSLCPEPGAWTDSPWGRLVLSPVHRTEVAGLAPGELRVDRRRVVVGTGTDAVELGEVTAPGKRPMPAADWARGARPDTGAMLGGPTR